MKVGFFFENGDKIFIVCFRLGVLYEEEVIREGFLVVVFFKLIVEFCRAC